TLLHAVPAGNLAYAGGGLLVADQRTLSAFVPPGMLLEKEERAARQDPAAPRDRLAAGRAGAHHRPLARPVASPNEGERPAGCPPARGGRGCARRAGSAGP